MATRPFTDDVVLADGVQATEDRVNHHHLSILAANVADLVGSAGGWLFDRARAGWDVTVWVGDCSDVRPLTILGANTAGQCVQTGLRHMPRDGALAVSAGLLRDDPGVRAHVFDLVKRGAEVAAWGDDWPVELGGRIDAIEHRLSVAARAFKAQALAAAAVASGVGATETLFDLSVESFRPLNPV
ncbi:hypothetical protein [Mycolicibacterium celeriflavum]|uniref:hypothetical protein n=1 Tax=Mycolicibacterium celeriflavum TaxID=1249101 RepID=UPI003CF61C5E